MAKRRKTTKTRRLFRRLVRVERFSERADAVAFARSEADAAKIPVKDRPKVTPVDMGNGKKAWVIEFTVDEEALRAASKKKRRTPAKAGAAAGSAS